MIKDNQQLDLFKLFKNGHDTFQLEENYTKQILEYLKKETYYNVDKTSTFTSAWDSSNLFNYNQVPEYYKHIVNNLIEAGYFKPYTDTYSEFDFIKVMLHRTDKGYNNYWHGHWQDGSHLHLLLHFSEPDVRDTNLLGGRIEFGFLMDQKQFGYQEKYNQTQINKVRVTGSYPSNNGECQVLLNNNPLVVHQVTDVLSNSLRYTLMVSLGYKKNIDITKKDCIHCI